MEYIPAKECRSCNRKKSKVPAIGRKLHFICKVRDYDGWIDDVFVHAEGYTAALQLLKDYACIFVSFVGNPSMLRPIWQNRKGKRTLKKSGFIYAESFRMVYRFTPRKMGKMLVEVVRGNSVEYSKFGRNICTVDHNISDLSKGQAKGLLHECAVAEIRSILEEITVNRWFNRWQDHSIIGRITTNTSRQ